MKLYKIQKKGLALFLGIMMVVSCLLYTSQKGCTALAGHLLAVYAQALQAKNNVKK